jgi:class 3 adenylate cyclase/tetratricopeptide (TPR) repeat protein
MRFCGECGAALLAQPAGLSSPAHQPAAERRLVSVLFADLVGFTTLSEARDAEEVRELLSRYFDSCKRLISLYGGTVEKFIGDAVMAVWGTPVAQEDDAERAVRAALDLVTAVSALGDEVGASALKARAGVLTGEAAVTIGAEGQGMVAGDLVNTASRIQSSAAPGSVLVGESTKRATEAAIAYADAGAHELKGKTEPVQLFQALRVTGARGGAMKGEGLEPPFVGRERELRLVKELFHASAEEKKAHLVSVLGIAGIGKSRLAWEFEKYIDGLIDTIYWHRGRCLAYGEGVTYWALAEMVRMRAEIVEGESPDSARSKLADAVALQVDDAEEQGWIEPRLAQLLGLEEGASHEREDLFAAWRLFFERMAETQPTVLVFEDMQWADASLLEFVDYLLEWSRSHPLFVLTLARPELSERHPGFGAGRRNATTLALEPLSESAMVDLLTGLVPGLPDELRDQILARAEGVPLYAVETVRMLLDKGLLERAGEAYRPTGPVEALEVPETLHALVAARLDGLRPEERRLLQDASVLGKTFTKAGLAALSGSAEAELDPLLQGLTRKEILFVQADPRSPERGQYGFLQDLLKRVAYETLAKKERKARHLAAAAHLEEAFGPTEQEVVEVVASHYLSAYEAAPEAEDAVGIKERAREMLARAGERAASLGGNVEALRYFEQAAGLVDEPLVEAQLREGAGRAAFAAAAYEQAKAELGRALALFEAEGETHPAARVSARLGEAEWQVGKLEEALERMERAYTVLAAEEPDADVGALAVELGRLHYFNGERELAEKRIEAALEIAESLWLPEVLAEAITTKAIILEARGSFEQSLGFYAHAVKLALEHDLHGTAARAHSNAAENLINRDRLEEALLQGKSGLALAPRVANVRIESHLHGQMAWCLFQGGLWEEAITSSREATAPSGTHAAFVPALIAIERGEVHEARRLLEVDPRFEQPRDVQDEAYYGLGRARLLRAEARLEEALAAAEKALAAASAVGTYEAECSAEVLECALALGKLERAAELLAEIESIPPGRLRPYLRAQAARFRARLAVARGEHDSVEPRLRAAAGIFREFGLPFWLGVALLEHGGWLVGQGRPGEAEQLLAEAREIFERLEAKPWLERIARPSGEIAAGATA